MKIQCQSCQAKYTIADEKVLGKVVKIRCKKCSSTIVINGNDQAADAGGDQNAFDYAGGGGGDQWTVNVADGDQRTMTVGEIATEYRDGVVNDETYCWKDGMADWLPLREIDQIYSAVKSATRAPEEMMSVAPSASVPPPAAAPLFAGGSTAPADAFSGSVSPGGNGAAGLFASPAAEPAPAAAARRAGGRAQGADLFGNVEKAGGEDEVMTSASNAAVAANAAAAAGVSGADEKLTGQRNENSVLFSLSALTEKAPAKNGDVGGGAGKTTATGDGSGLIDIRALSANMDDDKKKDKGARVDDIMNLSGGGAFGAALAAPILAPPPLEAVDLGVTAPVEQPKSNKGMIFAILGGCAFIAIGIVAAVILTRPPAAADGATPTPSGALTPEPGTGDNRLAGNDTTSGGSDNPSTGTSSGGTAANEPAPPGTGSNAGKTPTVNPGAPAPRTGPAVAAAPKAGGDSPAPAAAPAPAPPPKPASLAEGIAGAVGQPAGGGGGGGGGGGSTASFDKGAAAGSLGKIDVQSCKKADGPTGPGHVTVTFNPDGSVGTAVVDQGPYPGTAVGGCVAGKFRGAHVPAFAGAPVRVGKSFVIN
ncbi:MAG: zinc-ribbon domain-containing protein [Labilithrix sp.]|nr:zinc-ribbon domain-containing protein [Labilithrix sp.]MCW5818197.1 zinc-ribbon domain-containing protein [Labilithrix sp.]